MPAIIKTNKHLIMLLGIHIFERFLFFSVTVVMPLNLFSTGDLNASDMGLFYFLLLSCYRVTPVIFGYLALFIRQQYLLYIFLPIETLALINASQVDDISLIYCCSLFIGITGGATTTMILSLLEETDTAAALHNTKHHIFNLHFMLINAAAFTAPLLGLLAKSDYQSVVFISGCALLGWLIYFGLQSEKRHVKALLPARVPAAKESQRLGGHFFSIWLASASVWAACSTLYAIIPAVNADLGGITGINIWLSLDAAAVVVTFFVFKRMKIFSENSVQNAVIGIIIIAAGLLLMLVFKTRLLSSVLAVIAVSFGSYIAFPQLYGLAVTTCFGGRKTFCLGLMAFSGAAGEGMMQGIFWLTTSGHLCLSLSTGLLVTSALLIKRCRVNAVPQR